MSQLAVHKRRTEVAAAAGKGPAVPQLAVHRRKLSVAIAVMLARSALCAPEAASPTDGGDAEAVEVNTFDWRGGGPVLRTTAFVRDEAPRQQLKKAKFGTVSSRGGRRTADAGAAPLLDALWQRPRWRDVRFNLTTAEDEHPCFAGFASMLRDTERCNGFVRTYPPVGSEVAFLNTGINRWRGFTLRAVVTQHINVWLEEGATEAHGDIAERAARIYANVYRAPELMPVGSESWMEHECKVMGSMPFHYTCSDRINILVQQCGVSNAWVRQGDYLRNFPGPADSTSVPNHDIVFYMCQELLDRDPNPYAAANTFAHELAHVIQGGFGYSFNAMTEGGATWLEGPLLGLPPRPMVYAWGFRDWNSILAAHFYATTKELNARKFYQIHAMFLTYLAQEALLGRAAASALQNYQTFEWGNVPWGRMAYDYFLAHTRTTPQVFTPVQLEAHDPHNAFAEALLDFRVALAAQCIVQPELRPTEPRYRLPSELMERPFWDCSSFPTHWSAGTSGAQDSAELQYGGAAIYRLSAPRSASIAVSADAHPRVRTKVLAAGTPAEVIELAAGASASFAGGVRELFVVQANVDPAGELITPSLWRRSTYRCEGLCDGSAWTTAAGGGLRYPPDMLSALRSPPVLLPAAAEATLSFVAMWEMEAAQADPTLVGAGCASKGYDGVQVRLHVGDPREDGDGVRVLEPMGGYRLGPNGESALQAFALAGLQPPGAGCEFYSGWTDVQPTFANFSFSLAAFAGKEVSVELVFASDANVAGEGFWLDDLEIRVDSHVLLADDGTDGPLFEQVLLTAPLAGAVGPDDGVPVAVGVPAGYKPDRSLRSMGTSRAPWTASWPLDAAAPRRAHLGWSYSAPTQKTETALLRPWQEACMRLETPFPGVLLQATLFLLLDKMSVSSVTLSVRAASAPHERLATAESASPGVADPGTHRFRLEQASPHFREGEAFLLCAGVGAVRRLAADGPASDPFLHLPLTNVSDAGSAGQPGATFILVVQDHGGLVAGTTSGLDPWKGHTFVVRAEFEERGEGAILP